MAPDGPVAEETYRVIRDAMLEKNKSAIARVVLARREHPVVISVRDKGFSLTTLRSAAEVRNSAEAFEDIKDSKAVPQMPSSPNKSSTSLLRRLIPASSRTATRVLCWRSSPPRSRASNPCMQRRPSAARLST